MKDAWFKEVFTEFYKLSYIREGKSKRIVLKGLSDHKVLDYVILRITPTKDVIYYLYNGSSIHIPEKWIDLFSSLILIQGLESWSVCYDSDVDGSLSHFGYLMTRLICHLDKSLSKIEGEELLNVLGEISVIGTKEFREWCLEEFGLELDPFEYRSLDENLDI